MLFECNSKRCTSELGLRQSDDMDDEHLKQDIKRH